MAVNQNTQDEMMHFGKNGKSQAFKPVTGETTDSPSLAQPTITSASAVSGGFTVTFPALTGADYYMVEYNKTSEPTIKNSVVVVSSPKTVTGLTPSTQYKVRIKGLLSNNNNKVYVSQSAYSADSTVTTGA